MVFFSRLFPRKLEKKFFSNPTILKSKDFMIDIPLVPKNQVSAVECNLKPGLVHGD